MLKTNIWTSLTKVSKKFRKKTSTKISGKGKFIETSLQIYRKIFEKRKKSRPQMTEKLLELQKIFNLKIYLSIFYL